MKRSKSQCDLNRCFLCKSCLREWHPALSLHRVNYNVKKGEVIFREGEPVTGVYFVHEGSVKVHKKWGPEKELIIRFAQEGAIVGHRGLGTNLYYPVSGTALENGVVCFIPIDFFEATLKVNHELTYKLMMFFADELQESERKMRNLAHMPVKGRVAQALLTLKEKFGLTDDGFIGLELTRQDLASYAGATYETVFRTINELLGEKAIETRGKDIKIIDENRLLMLTQDVDFSIADTPVPVF
ncbi:Crp/Fnr family transcriptional regulator [Pedobacter sp. SYSU D00535]|uniref:Crp/Fnr family transcriptional regulator n=1 Tax=Pedobacter sp. SYSU D00535 TaxID=2810308 RepID=UPI001A96960C|nr:Crp/Fnr family transcriptional regulator [Pedobacter sp. SYSU D00535]